MKIDGRFPDSGSSPVNQKIKKQRSRMQPQLHEELLGYVTFGCEQKRFARRWAWTRSMVRNSGFVNHRIRVMPFLKDSCLVTATIKRRDIFLFGVKGDIFI